MVGVLNDGWVMGWAKQVRGVKLRAWSPDGRVALFFERLNPTKSIAIDHSSLNSIASNNR
jgi:hypothetical protein